MSDERNNDTNSRRNPQPASQPSAEVTAAPISSYSVEDREFFSFWYGHMKADVMQSPLGDVSHATARYIWDAARAAASGAEPVAEITRGGLAAWGRAQFLSRWLPGAESLPDGTHLLYASPAARQPLTEEEIIKCLSAAECFGKVTMSFESGPYDIARPSVAAVRFVEAVERAHGIAATPAPRQDQAVAIPFGWCRAYVAQGSMYAPGGEVDYDFVPGDECPCVEPEKWFPVYREPQSLARDRDSMVPGSAPQSGKGTHPSEKGDDHAD